MALPCHLDDLTPAPRHLPLLPNTTTQEAITSTVNARLGGEIAGHGEGRGPVPPPTPTNNSNNNDNNNNHNNNNNRNNNGPT